MPTKLPEELREALANQPGKPVEFEDPVTHLQYVLVERKAYELLSQAAAYDSSEPDSRVFYPAFVEAVKEEVDAPGMEQYDEEAFPPSKT